MEEWSMGVGEQRDWRKNKEQQLDRRQDCKEVQLLHKDAGRKPRGSWAMIPLRSWEENLPGSPTPEQGCFQGAVRALTPGKEIARLKLTVCCCKHALADLLWQRSVHWL